jgi:predicted nuclease of predicted toxin-antitoxin system
MTFWLDVHLDPRLASWMESQFGCVAKAFDGLGHRKTADHVIFESARQAADVVIMTKDVDFVNLVQQRGKPPQIVWLTIGNTSTPVLQRIPRGVFPDILKRLEAGEAFVEVAHA